MTLLGLIALALVVVASNGERPEQPSPVRAHAIETYRSWCAACHGDLGDGRSAAAPFFSPPPRNFTDCQSMASVADEELELVIRKGGHAVGKSPTMWGWEKTLGRGEIRELVKLIRSFCR